MENNNVKNQKLRVWWNPQVGASETFYIPVTSVEEGKKVMDLLSAYDCFQWNQNIKGDYCNVGGLEMWDENEKEWVDWEYEDEEHYYDNVDDYCDEISSQSEILNDFSRAVLGQVSFE